MASSVGAENQKALLHVRAHSKASLPFRGAIPKPPYYNAPLSRCKQLGVVKRARCIPLRLTTAGRPWRNRRSRVPLSTSQRVTSPVA